MGILLVFDITDERSFANVTAWIKNIEDNAEKGVILCLIGNKCDQEDLRMVDKAQAEELALKHNIEYMETSAKASTNVDTAFKKLAEKILEKRQDSPVQVKREGINITEKDKKLSCC